MSKHPNPFGYQEHTKLDIFISICPRKGFGLNEGLKEKKSCKTDFKVEASPMDFSSSS